MFRRIAGLVVASWAFALLIIIWRLYVKTEGEAISYLGWVVLYGILWVYNIMLRDRGTPEAQAKARMAAVLIFIPIAAYFIQRLMGGQYKMIEMAALISVYGLFLSWGWKLFRGGLESQS